MNINLNNALLLMDRIIEQMDNGFVACNRCGDQEETKNLDFADEIKEVKQLLITETNKEPSKEIELIAKQAIEIEDMKMEIETYKNACKDARGFLCRPEQWSTKCPDFPKVAMSGIVRARQAIEDV